MTNLLPMIQALGPESEEGTHFFTLLTFFVVAAVLVHTIAYCCSEHRTLAHVVDMGHSHGAFFDGDDHDDGVPQDQGHRAVRNRM